ncbi:acyl-CoA dehydrogenase family protein, partial [Acinetobacter baumannii]
MDFQLSEDLLAIQRSMDDFAAQEMEPYAPSWDEHKTFPVDMLKKAAALGLAGIYVKNDIG